MYIPIFLLVIIIGIVSSMGCDCCKDGKDEEDDGEYHDIYGD